MKTQTTTVVFEHGLHARQIALCVQTASQFRSNVYLESGNKRMNAKSIMGLMSMGIAQGTEVIVSAEGVDEESAVENMVAFLNHA